MRTNTLKIELWRIFWITTIAFIGGTLFDQRLIFLCMGFLGYSAWHLYNLILLDNWLISGSPIQLPYAKGLWREVFEHVRRLQVRKRERKVKFTRFREVASALPDAVVILTPFGEVEWCNSAAQRTLGLYWPKSMGQSFIELVRHPVLEEYLAKGDFSRPLEFASPANKATILSLNVQRFGKLNQHLLVARDITQVYHLNQARQDFVANVSHELRTPLTVISGFLENMEIALEKEHHWKRSIELMQEQTKRMNSIVNDLLALSQLEMKDEAEKRLEPVDVSKLLSKILEEAKALSGESRHVIKLVTQTEVRIIGDRKELRSAFSNLIFNSVKHTPPRAEIEIRWNADDTGAHLAVTDSGEGIAARHIPRLTERFYRVDPARSRKSGGTGLGLAIVKHVIEDHDGELHIMSEEGRGSIFTCHFPPHIVVREDAVPDTIIQDQYGT